jgi:hypothetical protein
VDEYMEQLKWTNGEPYERSRRLPKTETQEEYKKEFETAAYSSALHHDENTWDILNQTMAHKREQLELKIADRDLVQQCGNNPFMTNNNYVNDIAIRDQYLKPINTSTFEKSGAKST